MRSPSRTTRASRSTSRPNHSSSRSAWENVVCPYSDDSSAATISVTAAASAVTTGVEKARSMSAVRYVTGARQRRGSREQVAQLVQCADLDLPGALSRQSERATDLLHRLGGLVQGVVRPDHRALPLVQLIGHLPAPLPDPAALRCEDDRAGAAIRGVRLSLGKPCALELVDQRDHRAGIDAHGRAELLLVGSLARSEEIEQAEQRRRQA